MFHCFTTSGDFVSTTSFRLVDPGCLPILSSRTFLALSAASGLLRLLRPLEWQHLHVPLLPMSCRHVLKHAVDVKEPFLIGTYTSVLDR